VGNSYQSFSTNHCNNGQRQHFENEGTKHHDLWHILGSKIKSKNCRINFLGARRQFGVCCPRDACKLRRSIVICWWSLPVSVCSRHALIIGHLSPAVNEWMMFLLTCDKKLTKSQLSPTHAVINSYCVRLVSSLWHRAVCCACYKLTRSSIVKHVNYLLAICHCDRGDWTTSVNISDRLVIHRIVRAHRTELYEIFVVSNVLAWSTQWTFLYFWSV